MTNLLIASYKDEAQAKSASNKLADLESLGDITVYDKAIIKKNPDGKTEVLYAETPEGLRTLTGMAMGTLVGAMAGPLGMAVGMMAGTISGTAWEADYFSFSENFGSKVASKMSPGTVALIAEIDEDNPVFVDGTLSPLAGNILRSAVDYEYDKYNDEQIEELEEEIAAERQRVKLAALDEKIKIQNRIYKLKEKRAARIAELHKKIKDLAASGKSKFQTMSEELKISVHEMKISRLKNRIEKYQTKLAELEEQLKHVES